LLDFAGGSTSSEAARIESAPAGALADAGIRVEGGH
jgi:hypothetical protein